MNKSDNFDKYFDNDFEVTYEDDQNIYNEESDYNDSYNEEYGDYNDYDDDYDDNYDDDYDDDYDDNYNNNSRPPRDRYSRNGRNRNGRNSRNNYSGGMNNSRRPSRRRRGMGVPLAAPIQKGGKVLSSLWKAVIRSLTAVLIIATAVFVSYTFWRASVPYGDITEMIKMHQPSETLIVYIGVWALFILYELISLLWSLTRVRVRNGFDTWKEDTGRGLMSFIIVFIVSYACFFISPFLPETPDVIYGLKGAINVFGSMHNVLFGLCAAGVISCLARKFF